MIFSSYEFILFFLPPCFLAFGLAVWLGRWQAAKGILIATSIVFYAYWSLRDAALLTVLVLANHAVSLLIIKRRDEGHSASARALATMGVAGNLAVLVYFKYADLLVGSAYAILEGTPPHFNIVLPLGISFFTFQKIAFLVDCYKTGLPRQRLGNFALFVSFFPQLIAGPIVHHQEMMPQFDRVKKHRPWSLHVSVGLTLFAIGLGKKVLLADSLSPFVGPVFAAADRGIAISGIEAWGATLAYTLQLYFDFSGYSDMALGLARCFGIVLPANFFSPYRATSIVDFWRRWHMTLSRFLRDYIYIPLGGNRKGPLRRYLNLLCTMALGGIWHGANWTFLVWGVMHGLALAVNHFVRNLVQRRRWPIPRILGWVVTFGFVMLAWIPFRAGTFGGAATMLAGVTGMEGMIPVRVLAYTGPLEDILAPLQSDAALVLSMREWALSGVPVILVGMLIALLSPNSLEIMSRYRPALKLPEKEMRRQSPMTWRPSIGWALITVSLLLFSLLQLSDVSEFLYFQF